MLERPLAWLLERIDPGRAYNVRYRDLRLLPSPPADLGARISHVLRSDACDLLLVHRDRDGMTVEERRAEVHDAAEIPRGNADVDVVPVVPVRMTEAWLMFDEGAIREAARNPNGDMPLGLPSGSAAESVRHPKEVLHSALSSASGLTGRRLRKFNSGSAVHRLADCIDDWSPLERFDAFSTLRGDLESVISRVN